MTRSLPYAAFFVGLAAVCWVGLGYLGANPLALLITLLIGAFYLVGAFELHRFQQATSTLTRAVAQLTAPPVRLGDWLEQLHPSLQNPVRLRIEGERVGLPGPALTPYLAGLLVLLGMIGTFLGMVVTLNGTGAALESATDLLAIRSSLAAPVKGLGLAFGTSVAGVAASAMLGLASALCRRERLQAAQLLETRIATTLRVFSRAHRRDQSFELLQRQAEAMPVLVERLQAMMATIERQSQALNNRLIASQDSFHGTTEAAYANLASSIDRSLKESLGESARVAGATIQPMVEATMAGIAREAGALHGSVERAVQAQLEGLATRFEATSGNVAEIWQSALAAHQRTSEAQATDLRGALGQFSETFAQRSAALVEQVAGRLETTVDGVSDSWRSALAQHERVSESLSGDTQRALTSAAATFEQHSAALLRTVGEAHAALQTDSAARDQQRLAAWTQTLEAMAAALRQEWQQAGAASASQQQEICRTLAQTAAELSDQTQAHARSTIAEVGQLVQAAAAAPQAAAEVIGELRQKLSDSIAQDNAMLEERSRILGTLETLLDAVNHASTEQRAAIDALVAASADVLDRVGTRFAENVDAQGGRMAELAAELSGSAVEVASLGEAFGVGVQLFSQSSDKLGTQLQRIEGALGKSLARSDEQLAYYVAQAREVIDLSLMSQKQIVEDLQQLASERSTAGSAA